MNDPEGEIMKVKFNARDRRSRRRTLLIVSGAAAVVLLTGSSIAVALWGASATGTGSAKAVTAQDLTIVAQASPTPDLYPGASGALQFTITNPNPYPVSLTSWATGTITSDSGACAPSNVSASSGTLGAPIAVAAGATSAALSIAAAVTMAAGAPNACQGVTFTVALTLSGAQT